MTYAELQTLVADYLHRSDLTSEITGFIELAEQRIYREVRAPEMIDSTTIQTIDGIATLPAGYVDTRELSYTRTNNRHIALRAVGRHQLTQRRTGVWSTVYSIQGLSVEIAAPQDDVDFDLLYFKRLDTLSDSAPENDMLDRYPYLFLYGALAEGGRFTRDKDFETRMEAQAVLDIQRVNLDSKHTRHGEAPSIGVG